MTKIILILLLVSILIAGCEPATQQSGGSYYSYLRAYDPLTHVVCYTLATGVSNISCVKVDNFNQQPYMRIVGDKNENLSK